MQQCIFNVSVEMVKLRQVAAVIIVTVILCSEFTQVENGYLDPYGHGHGHPQHLDPFYPDIALNYYNGEYAYQHLPPQLTEKRIRHIKMNKYMWFRYSSPQEGEVPHISLNYNNWATFFVLPTEDGKMLELAYTQKSQCLGAVPHAGFKLLTMPCYRQSTANKWELVPTYLGNFWIRQVGTELCLQPSFDISFPTLVQLQPCDPLEAYQLWEVSDAYLYY